MARWMDGRVDEQVDGEVYEWLGEQLHSEMGD
jgi:hypothetical protein